MKKSLFVFFLIPFISCCQIDSEFLLQKSFSLEQGNYCVTNNDCFSFSRDTNTWNYCLTMFYSFNKNGEKYKIDCVDIEDKPTFNFFKSQQNDSYIILLKSDFEYSPIFHLYYLNCGKIIKIGEWGISEPYKEGLDMKYRTYFDYYIEDFKILRKNEKIEFSFSKDMVFVDYSKGKNDDWGVFKAGELVVSFNPVDGTVKRVEKRE